jgi:hypothetical protein
MDVAIYLLSAHRALLGAITKNTRAVLLGWEGSIIYLKFITIEKPTEQDIENFQIVGTEINADFPDKEVIESIECSKRPLNDFLDKRYTHLIFSIFEG